MPECTVLYIKVHCHNTKHFFSSRTVTASPLFPPQSPGTVTGGQNTGDARWAAADQRGRGDAGTLRAGKAQSRLPAKRDSLMTDKDARRTILSTEAQERARRSREKAEEVSTPVGGRNWGWKRRWG